MLDITEEHIRQSNLIENIDDPAEDEQSMVAWLILNGTDKLSHGLICGPCVVFVGEVSG